MHDCTFTKEERSGFADLQVRAANLRIKKIDDEKEFIGKAGKDLSVEECLALEKKRRKLLHALEVEGAEIEHEYILKYRSKVYAMSALQLGEFQLSAIILILRDRKIMHRV